MVSVLSKNCKHWQVWVVMGLACAHLAQADSKFSNESEAGVVITGGNTKTQSQNYKQQNAYEWSVNQFKFNGQYMRTVSKGIESARNWSLGIRYERILTEAFTGFVAQSVEGDVYAGILQRYNTDLGAKYYFIKQEDLNWLGELGYRFTAENRIVAPNKQSQFIRAYTEATKDWNKTVNSKLWIEYLPNFTDSKAFFLNTELSLTSLMTQILSLKTAYLIKYANLPAPGTEAKTDTTFTMSLVAKF